MKLVLLPIMLFFGISYGQDTIQSIEFKGECYNEKGNPYNSNNPYNQRYNPKRHKLRTKIEINIRAIKISSKNLIVDFKYVGKVKDETLLLKLNEDYAIKFLLARTVENEKNIFLYKLPIFNFDSESKCWRPISTFVGYYEVYSQNIMLNGYRIGNIDSSRMFQIVEGYINLD